MIISDVMDELAERLRAAPSFAGRTYAYVPGSITPPAAIVPIPGAATFDQTYGRGFDKLTASVVVVVGRPTDRTAAGRITGYLDGSGPESVKALLDGDDDAYTSCDSVLVTGWTVDVADFGDVPYLVAVFSIDIYGPGKEG